MKRPLCNAPWIILLVAAGVGLTPPANLHAVQAGDADSLAHLIQRRVEAGHAVGDFWASGQRLTAERTLPAFYRGRGFRPAWVRNGRPAPAVASLLQGIEEASLDGLDPRDYHLEELRRLLSAGGTQVAPSQLVDLELLATDAFLVLGSHLLHGRVDPVRVQAEWLADRRSGDMPAVLADALAGGDIRSALDDLRPAQRRYGQMREALARLREIEDTGGWPRIEEGPTLRRGDSGPRVRALRGRLAASGDLPTFPTSAASDVFDDDLDAAVRRFQARHGLEADGAVGTATRGALNVPVSARIERLVINLERWRWMPAELGRRHILVNIPDFGVVVRENGEAVLRLRAIVGREYRQTPVFSGRMSYLVLSPFWHVPPGIAANDKFPLMRNDPSEVAAQQMTLLDQRTNVAVDPFSVEWGSMTAAQFNQRYRLRQNPGPANALGDVKFMFPNPHNVYLHDTPSRELFASTARSFSSGCIRVERALELAEYLLRDSPGWDRERIRRAAVARSESSVTLPAQVPVHLQYWTAFVDDDGTLNYRQDIYGRDTAVLAALQADPPGT